ncbi:MAG: Crp/Fnr family transcriptional regulator, partial [Polyangiaceae bacterium]
VSGVPLEGIPPQDRARLLKRHGRRLAAGAVVFREGAPATEAFLLQEGRVRLVKRIGVTERSMAVLKAGDLFGENALSRRAGPGEYGSTAASLTEVVVLVLDRDAFQGLIDQYPALGGYVIEQLVRRVTDAEDQIELMMLRGAQSKVTTAILKLARGSGPSHGPAGSVAIDISPVELSSRVGLDVEAVKVAVQRLRDRNYLRINGERIEIPDVVALGQLQVLMGAKDELTGASAEAAPPAGGGEGGRG